jgi:hypothetical protein
MLYSLAADVCMRCDNRTGNLSGPEPASEFLTESMDLQTKCGELRPVQNEEKVKPNLINLSRIFLNRLSSGLIWNPGS